MRKLPLFFSIGILSLLSIQELYASECIRNTSAYKIRVFSGRAGDCATVLECRDNYDPNNVELQNKCKNWQRLRCKKVATVRPGYLVDVNKNHFPMTVTFEEEDRAGGGHTKTHEIDHSGCYDITAYTAQHNSWIHKNKISCWDGCVGLKEKNHY